MLPTPDWTTCTKSQAQAHKQWVRQTVSMIPYGDKDVKDILCKIMPPEKIKFNQEISME